MIQEKQKLSGTLNNKQFLNGSLSNSVIYVDPITQEKIVIPTTEQQIVTPDENYTGLSKVTVKGYVPKVENKTITQNGVYSAEEEGLDGYDIVKVETSGGSTTVEKGLVINSFDENGYATDVSIVGMTEIPQYYLYYASYRSGNYKAWLGNIGGNLHLPNDLTKINASAFGYCTGLSLTELPDTIREIGDNAFSYCTNLALTKLPSNVYYLGGSAFGGCTNLALTELPSGLKTMLSNAFQNCKNITVKEIPKGITSLNIRVFYGCTSITEMTFLGVVSSISTYVFNGCSNLEKLVIPNNTTVPTLQGTNAFTGTKIASGTGYIYVPDDLVESFKTATNWSTYAEQIKGVSELV